MATTEPNQFAALDAQADQLRHQLASKSSLFDLLSPPLGQPLDEPTARDNKLKRQTRYGTFLCYFLGIASIAWSLLDRSAAGIAATPFLIVALIGISAFTSIKLLRDRTVALEAESKLLREQLLAAANKSQ